MTSSPKVAPLDLGNDVWLIDLMEQGMQSRTGAYLILDEHITLIETASTASHEALMAGLSALNVRPADLSYVIVTHVHLDHAGGAGHLMQLCPKAKLVVHPRGARHMVDPSRLWEGARQVYGERLEELFGSITPVPESQILIREHGSTLSLGSRTLTFFDSPGHAKHHFTILDPKANALYAGDALGIRYRSRYTGLPFEWVMPSTSPVDFDPAAVASTIAMLESVAFDTVYHTHFGPSPRQEAFDGTARGAKALAKAIDDLWTPDVSIDVVSDAVRGCMIGLAAEHSGQSAAALGANPHASVLDLDVFLNALGLMVYAERKSALR